MRGRAQEVVYPQLYFVEVGDVRPGMLAALVTHFQTRYGVTIRTLPPMALTEVMTDAARSQFVAERVIRALQARDLPLANDERTRVIGITSADMFIQGRANEWRFSFSLRSTNRRFAVVSYARMNPINLGGAPDEQLLVARVRKMVAKNIGLMYYELPASQNPRSVLFDNILGVDDLDRMTEAFDP